MVGKKGLRLPRSLGRSMRKEGVSDPFFPHRKRENQTLFPHRKRETSYISDPLSENPLSATHQFKLGPFEPGWRIKSLSREALVLPIGRQNVLQWEQFHFQSDHILLGKNVRSTRIQTEISRTLPRATGVSPALRARNPKKVCKKAENSPEKVWKKSRKYLFQTFSRLFGTPGPEALSRLFLTFLGFRARKTRETPVARGRVRDRNP